MNKFSEQKEWQVGFRDKIDKFYQKIYPNLLKVEPVELGGKMDREGIDIILKFLDSTELKVQEKIRERDYGDFLVELFHNNQKGLKTPWINGKQGWYHKMGFDLMIYVTPFSVYLIEKDSIIMAVQEHKPKLLKDKWVEAWNPEGQYWTYSKKIKWEDIEHTKYEVKL